MTSVLGAAIVLTSHSDWPGKSFFPILTSALTRTESICNIRCVAACSNDAPAACSLRDCVCTPDKWLDALLDPPVHTMSVWSEFVGKLTAAWINTTLIKKRKVLCASHLFSPSFRVPHSMSLQNFIHFFRHLINHSDELWRNQETVLLRVSRQPTSGKHNWMKKHKL